MFIFGISVYLDMMYFYCVYDDDNDNNNVHYFYLTLTLFPLDEKYIYSPCVLQRNTNIRG